MERYNDEELLYLIHCGSETAEQCLYMSYYEQVKKWLVTFSGSYILGFDFDDYVQEAMLNFSKIIDSYRNDRQTSFRTYMRTSIMRRMRNYSPNQKMINPLDLSCISFDECITSDDRMRYEEMVEDPKQTKRPDKIMSVRETETFYQSQLNKNKASLETKVMVLKNEGYFDGEIAEMLNISVKSVYNAIYRYHKKAQAIDEPK